MRGAGRDGAGSGGPDSGSRDRWVGAGGPRTQSRWRSPTPNLASRTCGRCQSDVNWTREGPRGACPWPLISSVETSGQDGFTLSYIQMASWRHKRLLLRGGGHTAGSACPHPGFLLPCPGGLGPGALTSRCSRCMAWPSLPPHGLSQGSWRPRFSLCEMDLVFCDALEFWRAE